MTAIKICGLTRLADIEAANALQVDYVGFVFAKSKRQVTLAQCQALVNRLDPSIKNVGVFVNHPAHEVRSIADSLGLDVLQFHGDESPAYCKKFTGYTLWKALRVKDAGSLEPAQEYGVQGFVCDTYHPSAYGGLGTSFNWDLVGDFPGKQGDLVLAGGLDPANVASAIQTVQPAVVDVSSGVESGGHKDPVKMAAFVKAVRRSQTSPGRPSNIQAKFDQKKRQGSSTLVGYLTCGYPDLASTVELALSLEEAGVDVLELGVPIPDSLADGPVIRQASKTALAKGFGLDDVFTCARAIRAQSNMPLVVMTYYSTVFHYGEEAFAHACVNSGVDGLLVADLPHGSSGTLKSICQDQGLDLIPLIAPSTGERMAGLVHQAGGFVYCLSYAGQTGGKKTFDPGLAQTMACLREHTSLPLAIGFGISTPDMARAMKAHGDGVVVGSAITQKITSGLAKGKLLEDVLPFVRSLRQALDE